MRGEPFEISVNATRSMRSALDVASPGKLSDSGISTVRPDNQIGRNLVNSMAGIAQEYSTYRAV